MQEEEIKHIGSPQDLDEDGDVSIQNDYEQAYEHQNPFRYDLQTQNQEEPAHGEEGQEDKPNIISTEEVFERDDIKDFVTTRPRRYL